MKEIRIASLSNLSQTSLFLNMLNAAVITSSKVSGKKQIWMNEQTHMNKIGSWIGSEKYEMFI